VANADLVEEAAAELYGLDPEQFTSRRQELAAEARAADDAAAAKRIASLRKPTRSAWTLNALARNEPDKLDELLTLGDELRAAERALDGDRLRELSRQRRTMIDSMVRTAFVVTGQGSPAPGVSEEVLATLSAALADPEVAARLRTGMVLRAFHWDGFGTATRPDLALVPAPPSRTASRTAKAPPDATRRRAGAGQPSEAEQRRARAAAQAAKEREQRRAAARAEADTAAGDLEAAERDERARADQVRLLTDQLADAQRRLDEARLAVREARAGVRHAERTVRAADR
jgi:hypothetical protein